MNKQEPSLFYAQPNGYDRLSEREEADMNAYCRRYKDFLDHSKTERLCLAYSLQLAEENGFVPYTEGQALHPGDRVSFVSRDRNLFLAVIGRETLDHGANISVAHMDAPHLDVKPRPLYEESGMAYLKTYLYGWLRKHHYLAQPLALHGVVILADGRKAAVDIGEEPDDPGFLINDLLPHLGKAQNARPLKDVVPNDAMNVLVGSRPVPGGEEGSRFRQYILTLLHQRYGITEEDFVSAELEFVPAGKARDAGLDRSLIASYGQDDRVCGFAQLSALMEIKVPEKTAVCVMIDKEEINSDGVTSMKSRAFDRVMKKLCGAQGVDLDDCYANSFCISADVTSAYDPNFAEVYEKKNAAFLNHGIAVCKYTGHDGDKSDASDASAEVMGKFRRVCSAAGVLWQTAEMGEPEAGGGGTIAKYMANRNIDTLDAGVPVLSMHAPYETVAKIDCYMTYRAIRAVFESGE